MGRINPDAKNKHLISAGGSGSGKSYYIKQLIKHNNPKRLLVWDVSDEFDEVGSIEKITSIPMLYERLTKNTVGRFRVKVDDTQENYVAFCRLAMAWGNADLGELICVIEEGASVSNVGKSAQGELQLITQGRKFGVVVCYIIQSMAEGSKTAVRNINKIRIGLSDDLDINYITRRYGKDLGKAVGDLKGYDYVVFDKSNKEFTVTKAKST